MSLDRASGMQTSFGQNVRSMGFFWGGKVTKRNGFFVDLNRGTPFSVVEVSAQQTAPAAALSLPLVLKVLAFADGAKVCDSVVATNPVDVVNFTFGPVSVGVKPSKPVHTVAFVADFYSEVSASVIASCNVANVNGIDRAHAPRKNPGLRVIVQKFAQTFCGKIGLSHDAVLSLIGQRPSGVSALAGLRHFNTGGA